MPLNDRDINVAGRSSRASTLSNGSRGYPKPRPPAMGQNDMLATAPGVMSMLKGSTELGMDNLIIPGSRFSAQNRANNRRSGTASRISTGSSHSQQSRPTSGHHSHHAWPSVSSNGRRRSITSNFSNLNAPHYLDNMLPSIGNLSDPASLPLPAPYFRDSGRSFSLTSSVPQSFGLANYRSLTSLRGHEPFQRPRSPYRYPTRLKRPGYRPSSPALSDVTGIHHSRVQHSRLGSGLRTAHAPHGSHGNYGNHGHYGPPGPTLPRILQPSPLYYGPRGRSSPSVHSIPIEHMPGAFPPSLSGSRQGTPSIPDYPLPAITPTNSLVAPSSQMSSDAPSSTPPTPHNLLGRDIALPTIISNTPVAVRRDSNASASAPTYYDYSEAFEAIDKEITEGFLEPAEETIPVGFVNRIKTILKERATSDEVKHPRCDVGLKTVPGPIHERNDVHELPASPVVKRITREMILSNLQPTSEDFSATLTITQTIKSKANTPSNEPPASSPPAPIVDDIQEQYHVRGQSKASGHVSVRSDSTTATAAMDYALRYSPTFEQPTGFDDGNTMSEVLRNYRHEDTHMTTVIEEPSEPVTIATAEVEVAAPTPQPKWAPNFDTPKDASPVRPQSVLVPSSVYSSHGSSSKHDSSGRFSTPTTKSEWIVPILMERLAVPRRSVLESKQPRSNGFKPGLNDPEKRVALTSSAPPEATNFERPASATLTRPASALLARAASVPIANLTSPSVPRVSISENDNVLYTIQDATSPLSPLTVFEEENHSLFSPSPVSPLLSPALLANKHDSTISAQSHLSGSWSYRKPVPKRPDSPASITSTRANVKDNDIEQAADTNSTTDLRFSALGLFQPLTRQLDDVKEEPSLEISTVDLRASTFKFPLPQRRSSLAHFEEFRLSRESRRNASAESGNDAAFRSRSRALSEKQASNDSPSQKPPGAVSLRELRSIPSLHFSRVDLFSKLNEALDLDRDQDSVSDSLPAPVHGPKRPESTGNMRLKYRSFFESLDNMASDLPGAVPPRDSHFDGNVQRSAESLSSALPQPHPKKVILPKIHQWSPDDLLAELDRISIPSINGLTQRLSEMIPSLKRYYGEQGVFVEDDETVRTALDEIRRLGRELLPELSEDSSYTSGLFGVANEEMDEEEHMGHSKSSSGSSKSTSTQGNFKARHRSASSPGDVPVTPLAELEAQLPAILRSRSLSDGSTAFMRDANCAYMLSQQRRSLLGSPPESRPWNLETSYPWANSLPMIDISLPAPTLRRDHIKPRPSKLRLRDDITQDIGESTSEVTSEITTAVDTTETTSGADTFSNTLSRRRISKRSILGSISRHIRLPRATSIDNSGYVTAPDVLRGEGRAVDPGDRYPTTGLSPPLALNINEVRSFFSDDSSHLGDRENSDTRGVSLRKRLTNLKTKIPPIPRTHSALENRAAPMGPVLRRSNSHTLFFPQGRAPKVVTDLAGLEDAEGMPRTEFRAKKLVNRMKTLWHRGGMLLRTLSGKRNPRESHDWDDSGESIAWSNV